MLPRQAMPEAPPTGTGQSPRREHDPQRVRSHRPSAPGDLRPLRKSRSRWAPAWVYPTRFLLICSQLSTVVPVSCCAVFLHDEEGDTIRCRFASGTDAETHSEGSRSVWRRSGRLGGSQPAPSPQRAAERRFWKRLASPSCPTTLQSALVHPLVINGRVIGTLAVYHVEPAAYRDDHIRLLRRVAEQAAAAISNSLLFEQAQEGLSAGPLDRPA